MLQGEDAEVIFSNLNGIDLDGSTLEGGGQLLRNAIALSVIQRIPVRIQNIRQNRQGGGLKAQHVAGLRVAQEISNARAVGIEKGSKSVVFCPGRTNAGSYSADTFTAGSTALLLQIALPCLLFAKRSETIQAPLNSIEILMEDPMDVDSTNDFGESAPEETGTYIFPAQTQSPLPVSSTLNLYGGTNADQAPHIDYTKHVLLPLLRIHILPHHPRQPDPSSPFHQSAIETPTMNSELAEQQLSLEILRRGFYPKGGGHVSAQIPALRNGEYLRAFELLERGTVQTINGIAYARGLPSKVADLMKKGALAEIELAVKAADSSVEVQIEVEKQGTQEGAPGSFTSLYSRTSTSTFFGSSEAGRKGTQAQKTGESAARELLCALEHDLDSASHYTKPSCVDEWMQDQLVIFMALANGWSAINIGDARLSRHTKTAMWIAETLIGCLFEIVDEVDREGRHSTSLRCFSVGIAGRSDSEIDRIDDSRQPVTTRNITPISSEQWT